MSANFDFSSSDIKNLSSVLPEAIHRSREKAITKILNINSTDRVDLFKRIALIVRAECLQTIQEEKNELKNKKKKGCFSFFRRISKNHTDKNKPGAEKLSSHDVNVFDILTVLCLNDLSVLPTVTDIESFVEESIKLILNQCNIELPKILNNKLYGNLNLKRENTSHSPIIWLRRDSSRDRYLEKIEPDYQASQQINVDDEQHSECGSAFVFDKNCNWRSIYSTQHLSRVNSKKETDIDEADQFENNAPEDTVTSYIEKSTEEKNKLKERLEKVVNKNVIPLEKAHLKMSSLCQFIQDTDYGLNNHTNTSSECGEEQKTLDDNIYERTNYIDDSLVQETQNLDQQISGYVQKMKLPDTESANNENALQKKVTEQIICGENFKIHTLKSDEANASSSTNSLSGCGGTLNQQGSNHSKEINSKNTKFQPCKSDVPQSESKKYKNLHVKNNLGAIKTKNVTINNYKIQQSGHYTDNNSPRYPAKTNLSPEKIEDKKKHYENTLEKAKALKDERHQKLLNHLKQKEKRDQERHDKQLSEYEQKILQRQQVVKQKKFDFNHYQQRDYLHHIQRNGFID